MLNRLLALPSAGGKKKLDLERYTAQDYERKHAEQVAAALASQKTEEKSIEK